MPSKIELGTCPANPSFAIQPSEPRVVRQNCLSVTAPLLVLLTSAAYYAGTPRW